MDEEASEQPQGEEGVGLEGLEDKSEVEDHKVVKSSKKAANSDHSLGKRKPENDAKIEAKQNGKGSEAHTNGTSNKKSHERKKSDTRKDDQ